MTDFFFWLIYLRLKGKCRCVIGRNMLSDSHLTLGFILSGHLRYRISHLNWNMLSPCFQNEHEASMTFLIINGKKICYTITSKQYSSGRNNFAKCWYVIDLISTIFRKQSCFMSPQNCETRECSRVSSEVLTDSRNSRETGIEHFTL